jgi:putative transposase
MQKRTNRQRHRAAARGVLALHKTQTILPGAETAAMLVRALLASGQIIMRKIDGWKTLSKKSFTQLVDLAA